MGNVRARALLFSAAIFWMRLPAMAGGTAAGFLKREAGARSAAMAGAFTAASDGPESMHWNPAGLTAIDRPAAALSHAELAGAGTFDELFYAQRLGEKSVFGLEIRRSAAGPLERLDENGDKTGDFMPVDLALSAGYARRWKGWGAGIAVKRIKSTVFNTADALALDAGLRSPALLKGGLTLALAASNQGRGLRYGTRVEPLPTLWRAGGMFHPRESWAFTADLVMPKREKAYAAFGTEWVFAGNFNGGGALRAGYSTRREGETGPGRASLGFGLTLNGWTVDYALMAGETRDDTHRFSLSRAF